MNERNCRSWWLTVCALASMLSSTLAAEESGGESPLPAPTGAYSVGRTHFSWSDGWRTQANSPERKREVVVWVWYPAAAQPAAPRTQWLPGKWQELSAELVSRSSTPAATTASVRTHARTDAAFAAAPAKFPVLVFAPGADMVPLQYSSLIEDLASHGYVIAAVVPTGYSFSVLGDGQVVPGTKLTPPMMSPGLSQPQVAARMAEFQETLARTADDWSSDMQFAITQLAILSTDASSRFKDRLDMQRVGVFGHSQGGASSMQVGAKDARARAIVNIDGMLPRDLATGGALRKPALVLMSDTLKPPPRPPGPPPRDGNASPRLVSGGPLPPPPMNGSMDHTAVLRTANPGYHLRLKGSTHLFPSDLGVLQLDVKQNRAMPPGPGLALSSGSSASQIDAARALRITRAYVRAFFDQHLQGRASSLLDGPSSEYPQIEFERVSK